MKRLITFLVVGLVLAGCEHVDSNDKRAPIEKDKYVSYFCINGVQYFNMRFHDTGLISPLYNKDGTIEVCGDSQF